MLDFPGQSFISGFCPAFYGVLDLSWIRSLLSDPSLENAYGQLILSKIIKIVATRCQISRLKCTKFDFGWGSAPDLATGAYSAPQIS